MFFQRLYPTRRANEKWSIEEGQKTGYILPDNSTINSADGNVAEKLFYFLQAHGIEMTIITPNSAYAANLDHKLFERMAATGHPVGQRLANAEQESLEDLWQRANMAADDVRRCGN